MSSPRLTRTESWNVFAQTHQNRVVKCLRPDSPEQSREMSSPRLTRTESWNVFAQTHQNRVACIEVRVEPLQLQVHLHFHVHLRLRFPLRFLLCCCSCHWWLVCWTGRFCYGGRFCWKQIARYLVTHHGQSVSSWNLIIIINNSYKALFFNQS